MDIAIPDGNEEEFLAVAKHLGITKLRFLYASVSIAAQKKQEHPEWHAGVISNSQHEIRRARQKGFFAASTSNEIPVLESAPSMLLELEKIAPKDGLHARNSGLNQVLCAMMEKKGIALGISFNMILNSGVKDRAKLIGRVKQNIKLARKRNILIAPVSLAHTPFELRGDKEMHTFLQ